MNLTDDIAALPTLSVGQLRNRYAELFGEATKAAHKLWLVKRIAWRLQALAEGDLPQRARQRAAELANDVDLRLSPPRATPLRLATATPRSSQRQANPRLPPPGTILQRPYKGALLEVMVLRHGLEFEGKVYRSLSAVAKAITGSHCNGYLFFRLTAPGAAS